jgi:hypothetical protein
MKAPSFTRLILFTLANLIGAGLFLSDRLVLVGILLVSFSPTILLNKREREHHRKALTTPLTKWQIFRGLIPLLTMLAVLGCILALGPNASKSTTEQYIEQPSWDFRLIWTWTFKTAVLLVAVFSIGKSWMRWHQARNSNEPLDSNDLTSDERNVTKIN